MIGFNRAVRRLVTTRLGDQLVIECDQHGVTIRPYKSRRGLSWSWGGIYTEMARRQADELVALRKRRKRKTR